MSLWIWRCIGIWCGDWRDDDRARVAIMGLSFLNPLLFSLAALISLPIIAHLIQRRRGRDMFFPTIRFLIAAQDEYRKRIRLQNRHLLYLRAGSFVLLTFALTQPVIRVAKTQLASASSRTSAVILLDTSYSMDANDNGVVRMDRAKQMARDALRVFREGDQVALITLSKRGNEVLVPLTPISGLLEERLESVQAGPFSCDIAGGLMQAENLLKDAGDDLKEIFLISDMQLVAAQNIQEGSPSKIPINLHVLSVGPPNAPNTAVVDLTSNPAVVAEGGNTVLRALIKHFGADPQKRVLTQLVSGPSQTDKRNVDLNPNVPEAVVFSKSYTSSGLQTEKAVVESDILAIDNERYLVVPVAKRSEALVLDGRPGATDGRGASFFVVKALEACGLGSAKRGTAAFDLRTQSVPGDVPPMDFRRFPLVIICDVKGFTTEAARALVSYVEGGGGVLLFFGPNTEPGNINRTLVPKLLPYPLVGMKKLPGQNRDVSYFFRTVDFQSPVFELFSDLQNGDITLARYTNYQVIRAEESQPDTRAADQDDSGFARASVLAAFDSKDPAVISVELGRGRALFCASSPDKVWTDLPLKSLFVPVIGEMVSFLNTGGERSLSFKPGDPVPITVRLRELAQQPVMLTVIAPNGQDYTVAAAPIGSNARGFFMQTDTPGFYRVSLPTSLKDAEVSPSVFCVNLDTVESDLATMERAGIEKAFAGRFKVDFVQPSPFVGERLAKAREGVGLWNYLLLALWGVVMVETIYANRLTQN